jgi:hypothetical protein
MTQGELAEGLYGVRRSRSPGDQEPGEPEAQAAGHAKPPDLEPSEPINEPIGGDRQPINIALGTISQFRNPSK